MKLNNSNKILKNENRDLDTTRHIGKEFDDLHICNIKQNFPEKENKRTDLIHKLLFIGVLFQLCGIVIFSIGILRGTL